MKSLNLNDAKLFKLAEFGWTNLKLRTYCACCINKEIMEETYSNTSLRSKISLILTNDLQEINLLLGIFSVIINKIVSYHFLPKFTPQILSQLLLVDVFPITKK